MWMNVSQFQNIKSILGFCLQSIICMFPPFDLVDVLHFFHYIWFVVPINIIMVQIDGHVIFQILLNAHAHIIFLLNDIRPDQSILSDSQCKRQGQGYSQWLKKKLL